MMRIAVIGAGGQIGAEVVLRLSGKQGIELVPIARDRQSSAFLRFNGVSVVHGAVVDTHFARLALKGCDVVANFALASGTPAAATRENAAIVNSIFEATEKTTTLVFFSSLAVDGATQADGQRKKDVYSDLKRKHEKLVADLARKDNRRVIIFRLGHAIGAYQGLSAMCKSELSAGPAVLPDPDRVSNTIHTVGICDALVNAAQTSQDGASVFDLVNMPQWTWREVYRQAAGGTDPVILVTTAPTGIPRKFSPMAWAAQLRPVLMRCLGHLPERLNRRVRADYFVRRAAAEAEMLAVASVVTNTASFWAGHEAKYLPGSSNTLKLIESGAWDLPNAPGARWPDDLIVENKDDA